MLSGFSIFVIVLVLIFFVKNIGTRSYTRDMAEQILKSECNYAEDKTFDNFFRANSGLFIGIGMPRPSYLTSLTIHQISICTTIIFMLINICFSNWSIAVSLFIVSLILYISKLDMFFPSANEETNIQKFYWNFKKQYPDDKIWEDMQSYDLMFGLKGRNPYEHQIAQYIQDGIVLVSDYIDSKSN